VLCGGEVWADTRTRRIVLAVIADKGYNSGSLPVATHGYSASYNRTGPCPYNTLSTNLNTFLSVLFLSSIAPCVGLLIFSASMCVPWPISNPTRSPLLYTTWPPLLLIHARQSIPCVLQFYYVLPSDCLEFVLGEPSRRSPMSRLAQAVRASAPPTTSLQGAARSATVVCRLSYDYEDDARSWQPASRPTKRQR
jgi:hypothetical protein